MALRQIKPALQFSEGRSKPWSGAKLLNAFAEKADGDKFADFAVMATPGLDRLASVGSGPVRGLRRMGDTLYVVSRDQLYAVTQAGAQRMLGYISGDGPVRMADNGRQLAIATGGLPYVLSDGALTSPMGLGNATDVAYIDGYFLWSLTGLSQIAYSGINQGTSYDALDVVSAEGLPGAIIGLVASHRELYVLKKNSIEIFYNSGGADNAFERQGNAFIERGCFDRDSAVKLDNSIQFMGDDRIVYRLDGYTPVRISTHAIEYQLASATFARAFTYTQEGHKFYCLTIDGGTFCYDLATGTWHERQSYQRQSYRVGCAEVIWGVTVLADSADGRLYTPNLDSLTEDGEAIRVVVGLPTLEASRARVTMYAFEAYFESGVGLNSGAGSNPQIMMRYSDDGGRTWSNEIWRSLGKIGEYRNRSVWRSLGQFRQRSIELTITDPVRKFAMGYFADVR